MKFFFSLQKQNSKNNVLSTLESSIWKALDRMAFFGVVSVNPFNTFINVYWLPVSQFACFSVSQQNRWCTLPDRLNYFFSLFLSMAWFSMKLWKAKYIVGVCVRLTRLVLNKYRFPRGNDFKLCKKLPVPIYPMIKYV